MKGGVGKTEPRSNSAGWAAHYGKRVLLVDSEHQATLSQYIGVVLDACSTADLFDPGRSASTYEDVIQHTIYRGSGHHSGGYAARFG